MDGQHTHELDSPSFYNLLEIDKVVQTCKDLISDPSLKVSTADIGVIAAFRSQVLKLRLVLRKEGLGAINVGSVEVSVLLMGLLVYLRFTVVHCFFCSTRIVLYHVCDILKLNKNLAILQLHYLQISL